MTKANEAHRLNTRIKRSSQDSVAWLVDTGVFEDFVNFDTIHNIPLFIEIIDEKGLMKTGVFLCFSERKAFAMETDQYVTEWPLFDWFLMNRRFGKNDNADEFELLQPAQNFFHRFSFDFLPLGTDADCDETTILLQKITHVQRTRQRMEEQITSVSSRALRSSRRSSVSSPLIDSPQHSSCWIFALYSLISPLPGSFD